MAPNVQQMNRSANGYNVFQAPQASDQFSILGVDSQILNFKLQPGSSVLTEAGTLIHMNPDVGPSMHFSGFDQGCKRCMGSCCTSHSRCDGCCNCCYVEYKNQGGNEAQIGLSPSFPSKVIPIDLNKYRTINAKQGAFMTSSRTDVNLDLEFILDCARCCCAGQGMCMEKISGSDWAFLSAGGTILEKELVQGEIIILDSHALVAMTEGCRMDIKRAGSVTGMCCGGEGLFNTTVEGPGKVWVQSLGLGKMKEALKAQALAQNPGYS